MNGTSDEELINHYFNYPFHSGGALGVLFMHSIAFASILHYRKIVGPESVMVVNADDLDVRDMDKVCLFFILIIFSPIIDMICI